MHQIFTLRPLTEYFICFIWNIKTEKSSHQLPEDRNAWWITSRNPEIFFLLHSPPAVKSGENMKSTASYYRLASPTFFKGETVLYSSLPCPSLPVAVFCCSLFEDKLWTPQIWASMNSLSLERLHTSHCSLAALYLAGWEMNTAIKGEAHLKGTGIPATFRHLNHSSKNIQQC